MGSLPDTGWIPIGSVYGLWLAPAILEMILKKILFELIVGIIRKKRYIHIDLNMKD